MPLCRQTILEKLGEVVSTKPTPVRPAQPPSHAATADRTRRLEALRDRLSAAIEDAGPRDLASLAARYVAVLREIAELAPASTGDPLDDLTSRRNARRTTREDRP